MLLSFRVNTDEAATVAANFMYACRNQTILDVEGAARMFMDGSIKDRNHAFPPTTAEFVAFIDKRNEPFSKTPEIDYFRPSELPKRSEESKAKVQRMVDQLKAENRRGEDHKRAERWAAAHEQIMADMKELKQKTGSYLSPSLRSLLKQTGDLPADEREAAE